MGGKNPGGRQSALEQLYLAYRQDVYRYLCSLTRNASDAEDLLSETFLRALKRLPFFRGDCSAKTWLFGIARNLWLQGLRRRRPTVSYDDLLGLYVEDTVGAALDTRQLADRLRALLAALPARDREIVQLRAEGLSYAEIAARCGIRAGSARVMEYRARQWLRQALREEEYL